MKEIIKNYESTIDILKGRIDELQEEVEKEKDEDKRDLLILRKKTLESEVRELKESVSYMKAYISEVK